MEDLVNHPSHYTQGRIETIEYIEDCLGLEATVEYCVGNAFKYLSRENFKGNRLQDLKKAAWYLNRAIEDLEFVSDYNEIGKDDNTESTR